MVDRIVVVGGGLAAGNRRGAARARLRRTIALLADEAHPPYERPPLSKAVLLGKGADSADALVQRAAGTTITASTCAPAPASTASTPTATACSRGRRGDRRTTALVLATGARPRRLPLADDSGASVRYLRTMDDSSGLRAALRPRLPARRHRRRLDRPGGRRRPPARSAPRSTVLESLDRAPAAACWAPRSRRCSPSSTATTAWTCAPAPRSAASSAAGDEVHVSLADGSTLAVDHLLVGVGVEPDTDARRGGGLTVDNGVRTDARLRTSADGVYAAGDVANADHPVLGHPLRVEHWDTAIQHGKVVAANLLGEETDADALPYFFTDQYDLGMEYVGNPGPEGFDRVVVRGATAATAAGRFTAWWLRGARRSWPACTSTTGTPSTTYAAWSGPTVDADRLADDAVPLSDVKEVLAGAGTVDGRGRALARLPHRPGPARSSAAAWSRTGAPTWWCGRRRTRPSTGATSCCWRPPPQPGSRRALAGAVRSASFPDARHRAFGVDGTTGTDDGPRRRSPRWAPRRRVVGDDGDLAVHRAAAPAPTRPTYRPLPPTTTGPSRSRLRVLAGEDDALRFRGSSRPGGRRRTGATREAGHGAWFGAFLDGRLVASMGHRHGRRRTGAVPGGQDRIRTHRGQGLAGNAGAPASRVRLRTSWAPPRW